MLGEMLGITGLTGVERARSPLFECITYHLHRDGNTWNPLPLFHIQSTRFLPHTDDPLPFNL